MTSKKKVVVVVLIISLLGSSLANSTAASDWFAAMKFSLDTVAKAIAQGAFKALSNQIIRKVQNGGDDGGTAFIKNWRNFQATSQYRGEDVFRAILSNTRLCNYVGQDIKRFFGATQRVPLINTNTRVDNFDPFTLRANCTLPSSFNLANYQQDFAGNGGWDAWSRLLEPQNNYYGILFQSLDEAAKQRGLEESSAVNKAVAGEGFTGLQKDCRVRGLNGKCIIPGDTKTPGSILSGSVKSVFDTNLKFFSSADATSLAISALVEFAVGKLFDLGGGDTDDNYGEIENVNSYKNEFCSVKDDLSFQAYNYVAANFPQALVDFPASPGGKSYCERFRSDDNVFPYERCVNSCYQKVGLLPGVTVPPFTETPPPTPPPGGEGADPPADADTKHGNHTAEVQAAKDELLAEGRQYPDPNATDECYRFEIVERAVPKIGDGAGFLDKPGGNNCRGFAVDIIAFPDGYIYDVLVGSGDGSTPGWQPAGCGPVGGDGTCSERYRSP